MLSKQPHQDVGDFRFARIEGDRAFFEPSEASKEGNRSYDFSATSDELADHIDRRAKKIQRLEHGMQSHIAVNSFGGQPLSIIAKRCLPVERGNMQALKRGLDALGVAE